jgi:hypothetical protein
MRWTAPPLWRIFIVSLSKHMLGNALLVVRSFIGSVILSIDQICDRRRD